MLKCAMKFCALQVDTDAESKLDSNISRYNHMNLWRRMNASSRQSGGSDVQYQIF